MTMLFFFGSAACGFLGTGGPNDSGTPQNLRNIGKLVFRPPSLPCVGDRRFYFIFMAADLEEVGDGRGLLQKTTTTTCCCLEYSTLQKMNKRAK